jgi:hypothetical protein
MTTDPIIFGGATPSGHEEPPQLRYETTDKSGVTEVTAVISRRIHCLATYAPAIVQSASFPGQVLTINGTSYGAGWEIGSVSQTPEGAGGAIVAFECRRTGITPFEWSMPPGLSMEAENGIASLFYRPPGGDKIEMMRWDAGTGENRYGWKVEYPKHPTMPAYGCKVSFEGATQYYLDEISALASTAVERAETIVERIGGVSGYGWATEAEAIAAAQAAASATLANWQTEVATGLNFRTALMDYNGRISFGSIRALVSFDDTNVQISAQTQSLGGMIVGGQTSRWFGFITAPAVRLYADFRAMVAEMRRGLRWESVADMDAESATNQHIFYRLVYAGTVFFAIDVTAATPPEES